MNRWHHGLIVAAGFSLLLAVSPALADDDDVHGQVISGKVETKVDELKTTDNPEGVATTIHSDVLNYVKDDVVGKTPASEKAGGALGGAIESSSNPLDRSYKQRAPSRTAPMRGGFGPRGPGR